MNGTYCPACGFDTARKDKIHYRLNESNASRRLDAEDDKKLERQMKRKERQHQRLHNDFKGESSEVIKARREAAARKNAANSAKQSATGAVKSENVAVQSAKDAMQSAKDIMHTMTSELQSIAQTGGEKKSTGFRLADGAGMQGNAQGGSGNVWGTQSRARNTMQSKVAGGNKVVGAVVIIIVVMAILVKTLANIADDSWSNDLWEDENYAETDYDPYEYVTKELSESGEYFAAELSAGEYIVGTHLPEGKYTVSLSDGSGTLNVEDNENGIYLYEWFDDEPGYDNVTEMDDVRLFQGAKVFVNSGMTLLFETENGQTDMMSAMQNPLTETVAMEKGMVYESGVDFEPGVYDVYDFSEYGILYHTYPNCYYYDETDDEYFECSHYLDESMGNVAYKNIVLPQGTSIWSDDADFVLVPSPEIGMMDYDTYYE